MKIDEKKRIVEDLHEKFSKSKVVILTDYKGLDVDSINDLRRKLRESQIQYQVVKNDREDFFLGYNLKKLHY